jgi:hypothetical protein
MRTEANGQQLLERLRRIKIFERVPRVTADVPARATGPTPEDLSYHFGSDLGEAVGQLLAMVKTLNARLEALETAEKKEAA